MTTPPTGDRGSDDGQLIIGKRNRTRLQILMACVALAFVLANITSYLIGANTDQRTDTRIAALEEQVRDELNTRRAARDAEQATRDATTEQFRRDVCVLADHIQPRDHAVQQFRMRWGCTTNR